jgi:hypothetical protein
LAWVTLYPIVPIYLLLDFKYVHLENPFAYNSKVIFFSPLVTNARLSDFVPRRKEVMSTTRSQARATEDYTGLIGVTLKKSMFRQTS